MNIVKVIVFTKGSFNNYVDQILTNFDPLPPSSGQAWTFYNPPPCPRGQKGDKSPPPQFRNITTVSSEEGNSQPIAYDSGSDSDTELTSGYVWTRSQETKVIIGNEQEQHDGEDS